VSRPDPRSPPRPPDGVPGPDLAYRFVAALVVGLRALLRWRLLARGLEHLPRRGGVVLSWAHTSHVDFLVTALVVLRVTGRPVRFIALRELWDSRLFGWVPRLAGAVPVDRSTTGGRVGAYREAVEALRAGHVVMVAPEGTISESFELLPMRTGAARMAAAAGVPLVPSASWGSHRFSTTGHGPHPLEANGANVGVAFGPPLRPGPDDDPRAVTDELRARTEQLLHRLQEEHPDGAPGGAWWVPARLGGGAPRHEDVVARLRPGQALRPTDWARRRRGGRGDDRGDDRDGPSGGTAGRP